MGFYKKSSSRTVELQRSLCDAMIRSGTQLVELDLSDNAFGPIGAEGIEKFLESPSAYSLEVLKLNNNGLGAGGKVRVNVVSSDRIFMFDVST